MKHRKLTGHLSDRELEEQAGDLLQIAEIDPEKMKEWRALRVDLRRIAREAVVISRLLLMLFNRRWDRMFRLLGNKVFLRFPEGDLLHQVQDVMYYLRCYQKWVGARLVLAARVLGEDEGANGANQHENDIDDARAEIREMRAEAGPNGDSLDATFVAWTQRCALARRQRLKVSMAIGNESVEVEIPAKPQIMPAFELRFDGDSSAHEHPQRKIKSSRDYWLVTTVMGRRFLIPVDLVPAGVPVGAMISYCRKHSVTVRQWCILDIDSSFELGSKESQ